MTDMILMCISPIFIYVIVSLLRKIVDAKTFSCKEKTFPKMVFLDRKSVIHLIKKPQQLTCNTTWRTIIKSPNSLPTLFMLFPSLISINLSSS